MIVWIVWNRMGRSISYVQVTEDRLHVFSRANCMDSMRYCRHDEQVGWLNRREWIWKSEWISSSVFTIHIHLPMSSDAIWPLEMKQHHVT